MLFKSAILERIATGDVTLAFRRWTRPTVRAGGTLKTPVGVLSIDRLDRIDPADISPADAKRAGFVSSADLLSELMARETGDTYRVAFHLVGEDPRISLRENTDLSDTEHLALQERLAAFDRRGGRPWTMETLQAIGSGEGVPAGVLAQRLDMDKTALKRRIRKLKELGLTESLPQGYRLSPRGHILLSRGED